MEKKFNFAKHIVLNAASYIKEHLNDQLQIETKSSPTDLVTQMDKEVQNNLVTWILEAYPADHILAEENDLRHSISDGNVWVIDPIDGTNNFVAQKADFAVVLAYFENGIGELSSDMIQQILNEYLVDYALCNYCITAVVNLMSIAMSRNCFPTKIAL